MLSALRSCLRSTGDGAEAFPCATWGWRLGFAALPQAPNLPAMIPIIELIDMILGFYVWILIASVIYVWLLQFGILQAQNPTVRMIGDFLYRITEPVLPPIRSFLPYL